MINISDDILVFGATHSEHNQRLKAVFQRLREKGLTRASVNTAKTN